MNKIMNKNEYKNMENMVIKKYKKTTPRGACANRQKHIIYIAQKL